MKLKFIALLSGLLALAGSMPTLAEEDLQSHESIRLAARSFLQHKADQTYGGKYRVNIGELDTRLRLPQCPIELETFLAPGGQFPGRTTVGVRCPTKPGWTIFVPAKVGLFGEVLTAKRALPRGATVGATDVVLVERDLTGLDYGYFQSADEAVGTQATRAISAGMVLTPSLVAPQRLVKRGDRITVLAETAGLVVRMNAKAMMDGREGDRIRAETLGSKREVEGVVVSPGVIKVAL